MRYIQVSGFILGVWLLLSAGLQAALIGRDDFDGTETFLSKVNSNPTNRGALVWDSVSRATVAEQAVIDTSVSAGGLIGLNTGDVDGFLESTKTDHFFAMYRGGVSAARTLTYTFDISGSTYLSLSMDWACSGYIHEPLISVTYSIDGADPTTIFSVGSSAEDWTETMEDGREVLNGRSATVTANGEVANPLTDRFQTYTPKITGSGSVLTVTITMGSGVGGPAYGLDNIALYAYDFMDYLPQHVAHLEPYRWDKVQRGCFIRYIGDGAYPEEAVQIIAESCTYIHGQNKVTQSSREQFTIPYPKRIYRFAYKNLTKHYDGQDSIFLNVPQWFMHEAGGSPNIVTDDYPTLNLTNTNTLYAGMNLHEWWVADMRDTINPNLPGNTIFIDSLNGAMRAGQSGNYDYWGNAIGDGTYYDNDYTENYLKPLLAKIRDEFADEMIVTGNYLNPWFLPDGNYEYVRDYLHCCYIENSERFDDSYTDILNIGIDQVQRVSEDGKMIFFNLGTGKPTPAPTLTIEAMRTKASNAMPEFYASLDITEQDELAELYAYFEFKLAIFLLSANDYSYFCYQETPIGDYGGTDLFKIVPPFPEFQYPLGAPLGAAGQNGNEWTRQFEHASVWLNSGTGEAKVEWHKISAINCGGDAYTDANGVEYALDRSFIGGSAYTTTDAIADTLDDPLYQTERYGDFAYQVPVANGNYNVVLQFAEIYYTQPGKRQFNILIEGTPVLVDLDIYAEAGHDVAYDVVVPNVMVSDGTLSIETAASVENPKLSAFRFAETADEGFASWIVGYGLSGTIATETANPDSDHLNNFEEYIAGTNPKVFDTFGVSHFTAGGSTTIEWNAVHGRVYKVYWSSNLLDGFTLIGSNITDGVFIDTEHTEEPSGFYKVTVELE
ncbi:malectin domain-containing carbohydrate-binding protein [Coraliomargarita algicola]|uniref:Malectin domain-containing carbohydrate-binding protein n=1 Tax=Coraliomargarita algicola TaxID=3092156 RepID=A0ABZ0RJM9_9BACT|nr:malectin domain-containing carbohydrate-binding protein [Coraliomargarita sp. J2-16]WPJ96272.1 malectin domain-containing carbohydrate-binding protein [Coraliomargarita sp. J2-16]